MYIMAYNHILFMVFNTPDVNYGLHC